MNAPLQQEVVIIFSRRGRRRCEDLLRSYHIALAASGVINEVNVYGRKPCYYALLEFYFEVNRKRLGYI